MYILIKFNVFTDNAALITRKNTSSHFYSKRMVKFFYLQKKLQVVITSLKDIEWYSDGETFRDNKQNAKNILERKKKGFE